MMNTGVRRLPVLDRNTNRLVGILLVDDIALYASRSRTGAILRATATPAKSTQRKHNDDSV